MSRIDTKDWKEFRIGDLFNACLSKDDIQPTDIVEGNTPLISSGKENNGIIAYISDDKAKLWNAGTITVDMFGKAFYQTNSYHCVSHGRVNILIPKVQFSERVGKYIACVIEMVSIKKYQFTEMCTGKKLLKDIIKLPVDDNENPDWNYMEEYIKNLEDRVKDTLDKFSQKNTSEKIDTRDWKEFKVGNLFDAERGKIKRLQSQNDGNTPVIAAGFSNQGIAGMYDVDAEYENKITISCNGVGCGSAFYHPYPFNLNGDAIVLTELKPMNDLVKQFISCMLNGVLTRKYSYEEKCSADKAKDETIKLPVDNNGEPDWVYMENFMKQIELKAKQKLDLLKVNEASFAG